MNCTTCSAEMQPLFTGMYCPSCELRASPPKSAADFTDGFIVWRSRPPGSCEYVFETSADAERWRDAAGLSRFPIRRVRTRGTFVWRQSTGSVANIRLANQLFEVFEFADEAQGANQVFLVPA